VFRILQQVFKALELSILCSNLKKPKYDCPINNKDANELKIEVLSKRRLSIEEQMLS